MTDGKFATQADVTGRFEGTFPSNRLAWVGLRLGDVESELMFQVPSLRKSLDEITADSVAAGDVDRPNRVKTVVCEKVLDLFRNPGGPQTQKSTTTPDVTVSRAWSPDPSRGLVQFTLAEAGLGQVAHAASEVRQYSGRSGVDYHRLSAGPVVMTAPVDGMTADAREAVSELLQLRGRSIILTPALGTVTEKPGGGKDYGPSTPRAPQIFALFQIISAKSSRAGAKALVYEGVGASSDGGG